VAGYEMTDRVSLALGAEHNTRGYHTTGVAGTVAATVAAGIVMGFDAPRLHSAVGIACSSASGIKAFTQGTGGMVKRMHAGRAAEAGVLACELAKRGFTGPTQAIDGRYGLLEVIGGSDRDPRRLDRDLGESFAISRVWVKAYPCCGLLHTTAHALESIVREHRPAPENIRQIRVHTGRRAVEQNGEPEPRETMAAQYSIPYCVGVSLAKNARDPEAYAMANLWDPQVRALAARTVLYIDDEMDKLFPAHFAARVEVELADGRTLKKTLIDAHGMPADPCSAAEIESKFRLLAGAVKTADAVEHIIEEVRRLPASASPENLSRVLRDGNLTTPPIAEAGS
jgi:2-methylcitrate dehydratase PrpD